MEKFKEEYFRLSKRQTAAMDALDRDDVTSVLYGGAKGGGKTVFGCYWSLIRCISVIEQFKLRKRKFPIPVLFMGRKQSVDFSDTTLETWKAVIPEYLYELRASDKEIIIKGCVKIQYGGFDDKETVKKFNSAEYCYAFIDQAEEISRDDYGLLKGTLRRKIDGNELKHKVLLTANPAVCWLKDEFIVQKAPGCEFVQALPTDNPFLVSSYVQNLREAFKHRPELVAAYVDGNWDAMSGANIVFKPSWIRESIGRQLAFDDKRTVVACDPARFGDDETVIYVLRGRKIIDRMVYGQKSTMETAGNLVALKNRHGAKYIAVDSNGVGGGIVDRLNELKENVIAINTAEAPTSDAAKATYLNLRAQLTWQASEEFAAGGVSLPADDIELSNQLGSIMYEVGSNGKIKIEEKSKMKQRMGGRSPDRADAFIIGLHALTYIREENVEQYRKIEFGSEPRHNSYGWSRGDMAYA